MEVLEGEDTKSPSREDFRVQFQDIEGLEKGRPEVDMQRAVEEEETISLGLKKGGYLRVQVIREEAESHVVLFNAASHHIRWVV